MSSYRTFSGWSLGVAFIALSLQGFAEETPHFTLSGRILDGDSDTPIPARIHIRSASGLWFECESAGGTAIPYRREPKHSPGSIEVHTTLSAHPFSVALAPGSYTVRVERGKEYVPLVQDIVVGEETPPLTFRLHRVVDMAARGWYSGDTHTHRLGAELHHLLLAEDLNVAFPLNYWVTHSGKTPEGGDKSTAEALEPTLIEVDPTHVIYPYNTEYEIFSVGGKQHTLGAIFILNHKTKLDIGVPPVAPVAERARAEGALLDLDKHSWAWSLMLVPVMGVDLFELANNHHWQTEFGFTQWSVENAPAYMQLEMNKDGFTEWGWTDFGFQTYYALLNCGFRLRVSAGTASGVHPVQLGFGRVYVHQPDGFSYDAWLAGLNGGRSFVSNGPLLDVRFNGGHGGQTFSVAEGGTSAIHVTGTAFSIQPLDRIEIVNAGEVSHSLPVTNRPLERGGFENTVDAEVRLAHSSWIALRCFEKEPDNRVRFAHTNPVFIDIAGDTLAPRKEEVAYLVGRMDEELARNEGVLDDAALAEYEKARSIYLERGKHAR